MPGIFISYRREDSAGHAGRLFDHLKQRFAKDRVFMDVAGIEPGMDFVEAIDKAVGSCEVLIVVIGKQWLTCVETDGKRRLDNPNDFIRLEVATALKRDVRVIPVLVQGARMPKADELPDELARLARRQAVEVSDTRWDSDVEQLIKALESALHPGVVPSPAPEPVRLISQTPDKRKLLPMMAALASVAMIAIVAWLLWPQKVTVPSLTETPLEIAKGLIAQRGLRVGEITEQQTERLAQGLVLSQEPPAGSSVNKNTLVNLVLAIVPKVTVPNVVGKAADQANTALKQAGLEVGNSVPQESAEQAAGTILAQDPGAGQVVSRRAKIDLVIAAPATIVVPNLVNLPLQHVNDVLGKARLNLGTVRESRDAASAAGTVLSQEPTAGRKVNPGTRINLIVVAKSQTASDVEVPELKNLTIEAARNRLKEHQLQPGRTIYRTIEGYKPGAIFGQRPGAATKVKVGTPIDLYAMAVPPIFATGYADVSPGRTIDLDLLRTDTPATEADIRFTVTSALVRYLEPINGAVLAAGGKRAAGRDGCAAVNLSSNIRVMINEATVGAFICARTNRGRLAELLPYELVGSPPGTLKIRYVTWN